MTSGKIRAMDRGEPDRGELHPLPPHFRQELNRLGRAGIRSWAALACLDDQALRRLAMAGDASEQRLNRLRGQARLVVEVGLAPADAALLLHAGIATRRGLAEADPQRLLVQVGRLRRQLAGQALAPMDLAEVKNWILLARGASSR